MSLRNSLLLRLWPCFEKTVARLPFFLSFFLYLVLFAKVPFCFGLEIPSEWQQGAVVIGKVSKGEEVFYQGRKLRTTEDGKFVLGIGRDATSPQVLTTVTNGKTTRHKFEVKQREYNIQRVEGVPQQTVEPSPDQLERSQREAELVAIARKVDLPLDFFTQKFTWPLVGKITGVYGSQRFYNGVPKAPHYGVDIAKPVGTLITAPAGGVVTLVHADMFFSGGTLIIDHGHGLSSTFIHLSKILVKKDDTIKQGQKIALVGQTGRASGPHLHWAMNWFETRVDPQLMLEPAAAQKSTK
jgi:murein DD-endopeptidase MepM/ murein hydrolase activator NlpD